MDRDLTSLAEGPGDSPLTFVERADPTATLRSRLGERSVVLVGLMGAGKTTIGRRLAARLDAPFRDADAEIEAAAGMSIPEIFAIYGERAFRDGERRVIARLLGDGPIVLATGGGAYMDAETRARVATAGVSVWLKADHATLMRRVRRRTNRPLLNTPDPDEAMRRLMTDRHPVYATADLTIDSRDVSHDRMALVVIEALQLWLDQGGRVS